MRSLINNSCLVTVLLAACITVVNGLRVQEDMMMSSDVDTEIRAIEQHPLNQQIEKDFFAKNGGEMNKFNQFVENSGGKAKAFLSSQKDGGLAFFQMFLNLAYGGRDIKRNALECDLCIPAADIYFNDLRTGGDNLTKLEKIFDDVCTSLPNATSGDVTLCKDVAWVFLEGSHWIVDFVQRFKFNLTQVMCTDIFPVCTVDCCVSPTAPEQIYISFPQSDSEKNVITSTPEEMSMQVTWIVQTPVSASSTPSDYPLVEFWKAEYSPSNKFYWVNFSDVSSTTYTVSGWNGAIYSATMKGLGYDTQWRYRVRGTGDWSETKQFRTLHQNAGDSTHPLKAATFADMGTGGTHDETINRLKTLHAAGELHLILHTGDISYADGDSHRWDRFMREMEPIVSEVPYMTVPGNHELLYNFTAYRQRFFKNPKPSASSGFPNDSMFYSFNINNLTFLMLDSESPIDLPHIGALQYRFASSALRQAKAQRNFIFAGFHRPLYCSNGGTGIVGKAISSQCNLFGGYLRLWLENIFVQNGVAFVQTGHIHDYERTYPVLNGKRVSTSYYNTTAPVVYVNGSPGCEEGLSHFHGSAQPEWSAKRFTTTSFLHLTLTEESSVNKEYVVQSNLLASGNGTIIDNITLTKFM